MTDQLNAGDTVYNIYGQEGEYITAAPGGYLVFPIFEGEEGDSYRADAETWKEVFAKPPEARLHKEIENLQKQIDASRGELAAIQKEKAEHQRSEKEAQQKIKSRPDLSDFYLWLSGEVTHIVSFDYSSMTIGTVEQILTKNEDHGKTSLRLCSIYVDPKANRYWTAYSAYSDGSSSHTKCRLARSLEEAKEIAAVEVQKRIKEGNYHSAVPLIRAAIKYGVEVTPEQRAQAEEHDAKEKQRHIDGAKAELDKAQQRLNVLLQS